MKKVYGLYNKNKLLLFIDDIIIYLKDLKGFINKLL